MEEILRSFREILYANPEKSNEVLEKEKFAEIFPSKNIISFRRKDHFS